MTSISDHSSVLHSAKDSGGASSGDALKQRVAAAAFEAGFAGIKVTSPAAIGPAGERLKAFLADGRHGDMIWMAGTVDRRADPKVLWPDVRSILLLGLSYAPQSDPLAALADSSNGAVSC